MFTCMQLIANAFFRVSRLSRRKMVCWPCNPSSYVNSKDASGASNLTQLSIPVGVPYYTRLVLRVRDCHDSSLVEMMMSTIKQN